MSGCYEHGTTASSVFNTIFFTKPVPDAYPLKSVYPDLATLQDKSEVLETHDQLWKFMSGDSRWYMAQARQEYEPIAPYRYRIFPIYIVQKISAITKFSVHRSFLIVNCFSAALSALLLAVFCMELGFSFSMACVGGLIFLTLPPVSGTVAFPLLEPLSFFETILIFYAALKRLSWLFIVSSIAAVLTKEVLVWSCVMWLINSNFAPSWRKILVAICIASVPVLAFVIVRLWLGHGAIEINYGFNILEGEIPDSYYKNRMGFYHLAMFAIKVLHAFGICWLGVFSLARAPLFLQRSLVVVPLTIIALFVLSSQVTRNLGILYPVMIPLFLCFVDNLLSRFQRT